MAGLGLQTAIFIFAFASSFIDAMRYEAPSCEAIEDHYKMFPADDPRTFYVCLPDGNSRQVECEAGQVFVDNEDLYGCAPYDMSPCAKNFKQIDCNPGADRNTLVVSQDPNKYWLCSAPNGVPVELPCAADKGFVKNETIMGCISWAEWSC